VVELVVVEITNAAEPVPAGVVQRAEDSEMMTKSVHGLPPTVMPVMSVKPLSAMVMTVPGGPDEGDTEVFTDPPRDLMSWLPVSATYR
jgi:hypothetical protein